MSFCLVLLAAGDSKRFKSKIPKPFVKIGEKTLLEFSLLKFSKFKQIKKTVVVINYKHKKFINKIKRYSFMKIIGGKTRQESTFKALKFIKKRNMNCKNVLIHDVARPNFSLKLIKKIINSAKRGAVVPKINIHDALKKIIGQKDILNLSREDFFCTQTPQSFNFDQILKLHQNNKILYKDDDSSLIQSLGNIKFIDGEKGNFKITNKQDFELLKNSFKIKIKYGVGFDVHRLVPERKLFLGGLKIKSKIGTLGHSDGDPVLHSITDAILGATGMGDIGTIFSDKDNKFKNIRSTILLKKIIRRIEAEGYFINNLDINIITETPKLQKLKNKIVKNISQLCEIPKNKINLKGKSTEKLGVIGKEKAIASEVIACLYKYV